MNDITLLAQKLMRKNESLEAELLVVKEQLEKQQIIIKTLNKNLVKKSNKIKELQRDNDNG